MRVGSVVKYRKRAEAVEDFVWIVETGETNVEAIASRLGMSIAAIEQATFRAARRGNTRVAELRARIDWEGGQRRRWAS